MLKQHGLQVCRTACGTGSQADGLRHLISCMLLQCSQLGCHHHSGLRHAAHMQLALWPSQGMLRAEYLHASLMAQSMPLQAVHAACCRPTGARWCNTTASSTWVARLNRASSQALKALHQAKAIADAHAEATDAQAATAREHVRQPVAAHSATARIKGVPPLQPADEMCNAARKALRRQQPKKGASDNAPAAKMVRL